MLESARDRCCRWMMIDKVLDFQPRIRRRQKAKLTMRSGIANWKGEALLPRPRLLSPPPLINPDFLSGETAIKKQNFSYCIFTDPSGAQAVFYIRYTSIPA